MYTPVGYSPLYDDNAAWRRCQSDNQPMARPVLAAHRLQWVAGNKKGGFEVEAHQFLNLSKLHTNIG
jgi:hypothetical protein